MLTAYSSAFTQCTLPFVTVCPRSPHACPLTLDNGTVRCERCGGVAPVTARNNSVWGSTL
jgi:hypothetical protein